MNGWTFWGFQSCDGTLVPLAELRLHENPSGAARRVIGYESNGWFLAARANMRLVSLARAVARLGAVLP